jgi:hypothetical protein
MYFALINLLPKTNAGTFFSPLFQLILITGRPKVLEVSPSIGLGHHHYAPKGGLVPFKLGRNGS